MRSARSKLPLVGVYEHGKQFSTGVPVTFEFIRNTEPAPNMGSRFQQDIEPTGRYVSHRFPSSAPPPAKWETGTIKCERPLVMKWSTGDGYDSGSWKAHLVTAYKAKRAALTRKLIRDGYDCVVTVRGGETSEIVKLGLPPKRRK